MFSVPTATREPATLRDHLNRQSTGVPRRCGHLDDRLARSSGPERSAPRRECFSARRRSGIEDDRSTACDSARAARARKGRGRCEPSYPPPAGTAPMPSCRWPDAASAQERGGGAIIARSRAAVAKAGRDLEADRNSAGAEPSGDGVDQARAHRFLPTPLRQASPACWNSSRSAPRIVVRPSRPAPGRDGRVVVGVEGEGDVEAVLMRAGAACVRATRVMRSAVPVERNERRSRRGVAHDVRSMP